MSVSIDLQDQRALVTGASTGIGRGIAVALAEAGADVAIHYSKQRQEADTTAELVQARGRRAMLIQGDFRRPAEVRHTVTAAVAQLGAPLDMLVNNAGDLIQRVPLADMAIEFWNDMLALNLTSMFVAVQTALPHLREGARIVNISSLSALSGAGMHAFAYAAAKGGVVSLTRSLALDLAPLGIRVNCIAPGVTPTPFHDRFNTPERLEAVRQTIPLRRLGTPEDCAGATLYLVSSLSAFVTGEVLEVNGGAHFG